MESYIGKDDILKRAKNEIKREKKIVSSNTTIQDVEIKSNFLLFLLQ